MGHPRQLISPLSQDASKIPLKAWNAILEAAEKAGSFGALGYQSDAFRAPDDLEHRVCRPVEIIGDVEESSDSSESSPSFMSGDYSTGAPAPNEYQGVVLWWDPEEAAWVPTDPEHIVNIIVPLSSDTVLRAGDLTEHVEPDPVVSASGEAFRQARGRHLGVAPAE